MGGACHRSHRLSSVDRVSVSLTILISAGWDTTAGDLCADRRLVFAAAIANETVMGYNRARGVSETFVRRDCVPHPHTFFGEVCVSGI